jgi:hypothetical protein
MGAENRIERRVEQRRSVTSIVDSARTGNISEAEKIRNEIRRWRIAKGEPPVQPVKILSQILKEKREEHLARDGIPPAEVWGKERAKLCQEFLEYMAEIDPSFSPQSQYVIAYTSPRREKDVALYGDGFLRTIEGTNLPLDEQLGGVCKPVLGGMGVRSVERPPHRRPIWNEGGYGSSSFVIGYKEGVRLRQTESCFEETTDLESVLTECALRVAREVSPNF